MYRLALTPWLTALAVACAAGCVGRAERGEPAERPAGSGEPGVGGGRASGPAPPSPEDPCEREIARLEGLPALPGAPDFEARRAEMFLRAKAHSVILTREPGAGGIGPEAAGIRAAIHGSSEPVKALFAAYPRLRRQRALGREVLLSEGYLYSPSPWFASALTNSVRLEDLFREDEIFLERGATRYRLTRRKEGGEVFYVHADGPEAGRRAKLILLDRVALTEAELSAPLHLDVAKLSGELGFDGLEVLRLTAEGVLARLAYGEERVIAVLDVAGSRLSARCELVPPGRAEAVSRARAVTLRRERVMGRLRAVMDEQVEENLPFDEPKTEYGQEDGKLRQHWRWAYRYGQSKFEFNEDWYRVFDLEGRPRVPQVCIDFIRDTLERAGGSWYRRRGEPRERTVGPLDFAELGIENERSVEHFIAFARSRPDWFDVRDIDPVDQVPYSRRAEFFSVLIRNRSWFLPGDVVVIYGLRDDEKMHYHTFFVYDSDRVTGVPALVAANAGRPRVRPFEGEMLSAPRRSIRTRLRPRLEWLESLTEGGARGAPAVPGTGGSKATIEPPPAAPDTPI